MIQLEIFRRIMLKGSGVQPRVIAPTKSTISIYTEVHICSHFYFLNSITLLEILEESLWLESGRYREFKATDDRRERADMSSKAADDWSKVSDLLQLSAV